MYQHNTFRNNRGNPNYRKPPIVVNDKDCFEICWSQSAKNPNRAYWKYGTDFVCWVDVSALPMYNYMMKDSIRPNTLPPGYIPDEAKDKVIQASNQPEPQDSYFQPPPPPPPPQPSIPTKATQHRQQREDDRLERMEEDLKYITKKVDEVMMILKTMTQVSYNSGMSNAKMIHRPVPKEYVQDEPEDDEPPTRKRRLVPVPDEPVRVYEEEL